MGQVSSLITQKLGIMAEAEDWSLLQSKYKAITTFLPYAVWQERHGEPETLDAFLHAASASRMIYVKQRGFIMVWVEQHGFGWCRFGQCASRLLSEASPRATVLASPYIPWDRLTDGEDLIPWWVVATSVVQCTEEVSQSVVDTLLQIASQERFLSHIPADLWLWLTKRPFLPPVCVGRVVGNHSSVFTAVRSLGNIEITKSYLLLAWSEWGILGYGCFNEMRTSMYVDFGGTGMGRHRADLIRRLDHILWRLDLGFEYLHQHNPYLGRDDLQIMKQQYMELKQVLLEVEWRAWFSMATNSCILTPAGTYRVSCNICPPSSPPSIGLHPEHSVFVFNSLLPPSSQNNVFLVLLLYQQTTLRGQSCQWRNVGAQVMEGRLEVST